MNKLRWIRHPCPQYVHTQRSAWQPDAVSSNMAAGVESNRNATGSRSTRHIDGESLRIESDRILCGVKDRLTSRSGSNRPR
jgi:hypothetical protein